MTLTPKDVTPDDAKAVLAHGVSKQGVKDALYVAAVFSMITRLADAFRFEIPSDDAFATSAKALLRFGYKL